jgi:L-amino acid N-acyltransferase YncA/transposase
MCLRFVFLLTTHVAASLRLSRREEAWKAAEILILRHQLAVLQRRRPCRLRLNWADRALLAALLAVTPKARHRGLRLLVTPDTIVRWHRDIVRRRWAARSAHARTGRPATRRNIQALVRRLARQNPEWGYRRIHGELAGLGVNIAAPAVWEILKASGIDPARQSWPGWSQFLRSQAETILARPSGSCGQAGGSGSATSSPPMRPILASAKRPSSPGRDPHPADAAADSGQVLAIYQAGLDGGQASFETTAPAWDAFDRAKLSLHRHVAAGASGQVLGWAAASPLSDRCAYSGVVEHSVYVQPAAQGRGIGAALVAALIGSTESAGIWTIQTGIFPGDEAPGGSLTSHPVAQETSVTWLAAGSSAAVPAASPARSFRVLRSHVLVSAQRIRDERG